jgi:hypothetical protein
MNAIVKWGGWYQTFCSDKEERYTEKIFLYYLFHAL